MASETPLVIGAFLGVFVLGMGRFAVAPSTGEAHDAQPVGPKRAVRDLYAGSEACRSCHPGEHASFARTFHRTMTQKAKAASVGRLSTVLAPVPSALTIDGERLSLEASDGAVVVRRGSGARERIALTTGSHHYQAYWAAGDRPGELQILPFVYMIAEKRFAPRRAVFLTPDDTPPNELPWSASCIQCHAVAGRPKRSDDGSRFDTDVVELGISCEACHGPGAAHADAYRDPFARAAAHGKDGGAKYIVNPKKLEAAASTAVCAQCHSLSFPRDEAAFWRDGTAPSRPDLAFSTRALITRELLARGIGPRVDAPLDNLFWPDGTIRVGGREANAHFSSPCFERGTGDRKPSCVTCHSMHASEPSDQLARSALERSGDGMCVSCHEKTATNVEAHTHHSATSEGSRCVSCHMPKTTFALLGAIRTHRIEVPDAALAPARGRLPACNLCHLDRSIAWTGDRLAAWYGRKPPALRDETSAVEWLLAGDAAKRALAAAHFAEPAARAASGVEWQPPLLARLLEDPYPAVRHVAARALRAIPGYAELPYDFVAPAQDRARARDAADAIWRARGAGTNVAADQRGRVLLRADGQSDNDAVLRLASQRDDRAITIAE